MRYLLSALLTVSILALGCSKKEMKTETQVDLSIEPSGYYWLNLMPVIPKEGPSFHTVFKIKVTNSSKAIVKNVKAVSATIYTVFDDEEKDLGSMELDPSPNTPVENNLLPGEQINLEFGGFISGATQVTPGMTVYGRIFVVWDSGHTTVATPPDEVMATH